MTVRAAFEMKFDIASIKHLGLQMYSTLPPVIGELVSNAWDAEASRIEITIPTGQLNDDSEIVADDDGLGMTDRQVRERYLIVGRDRRKEEGTDESEGALKRPLMGRKGIGKFSGFGIAQEIEIESIRDGETSRFVMPYEKLEEAADRHKVTFDALDPTGNVSTGTRITLRRISKYRTRSIPVPALRRGLARRFSVIGEQHGFEIVINGKPITIEERDLKQLLENDADGNPYLWEFDDVEISEGTGWKVSGWIGALKRTDPLEDGIQRGVAIMARGKLVQEPFTFEANVGQQFALSYLVGEIHAEFVDGVEDTVGTTRNSLVWDTEANAALKEWGQLAVNRIAREWADRRATDNESELKKNPLYVQFSEQAAAIENRRAVKVADKLIRQVVKQDVISSGNDQESVVQLCLDFLEFDAFWELADELTNTEVENPAKVAELFREWELVEAREMMRVTDGRIATIQKLQKLIDEDALEVPTLHRFLKEFPWVLDPRWNLIADEAYYSQLLREKFPDADKPEKDRRIDFLCVKENAQLIVVEIKRPGVKASVPELEQIRDYVYFMREQAEGSTDPDYKNAEVVGYLLCGDVVHQGQNAGPVRHHVETLRKDGIYVRRYAELLAMVQRSHKEFLERYEKLRTSKAAAREPDGIARSPSVTASAEAATS